MIQSEPNQNPDVKDREQANSKTAKARQRAGLIPWAKRGFPYLKDEVQHLADRFWNLAEDELFSGDLKPRTDIVETESSLIIQMDVPGFEPEQIDVLLDEKTITIRSQHQPDCDEHDDRNFFHRHERRCGSFSRTFALPREVKNQASAECRHGVLTVTLPKAKNNSSRKIKVNT